MTGAETAAGIAAVAVAVAVVVVVVVVVGCCRWPVAGGCWLLVVGYFCGCGCC